MRSLTRFHISGLFIWSLLVLLQAMIWASWENALAGGLTLCGGILGVSVCFRQNLLRSFPLSTIMMTGYVTYYFLLPPIASLTEGKPLTFNLKNPDLVFIHSLLCLIALITAHTLYRNSNLLNQLRRTLSEKLYRPAGFFKGPGNLQLLLMGCMGMLATIEQIFIGGGAQKELLGAGNKFVQALYPLTYLPYAILVRPLMGQRYKINVQWLAILSGYTAILFMVSMGKNSRSAFFMGIMSVAMAYIYGVSLNFFSRRIFHPKNILIAVALFFILSGPMTDFATSMVIVRGQRANISAMELANKTIDTFLDKQAIETFRRKKGDNRVWDERYVDNLFLARMANLKFTDNSLSLADTFNSGHHQHMRSLEWQKTLSVFPRPFLSLFDISIDKNLVSSASGGDLLLYVVTRSPFVLGGFRTGSILGSGYALFGWFYLIVITGISVVIFTLADAQTSRQISPENNGVKTLQPVLNPLCIATFFTWFFYFTSAATGTESMAGFAQFILRGWLQSLFIYATAYWMTFLLLRPFKQ